MKTRNILVAVLVVVLILAVGFFIFSMMSRDSKAASFDIADGNLVISSSFGVTVPLSEIHALKIVDTMPTIETKTNGAGLGDMYKGEFKLEGGIKARLYVDASKPPFINFTQGATFFYINAETPEKTRELFNELNGLVK